MHSYLRVLRKYGVFNGRASRREYWLFIVVHMGVFIALVFVGDLLAEDPSFWVAPADFYLLGTLLPTLAVNVRRLHDSGLHGAWVLIGFIPLIGTIGLLVMMLRPSDEGENRYGPDPRLAMASSEERVHTAPTARGESMKIAAMVLGLTGGIIGTILGAFASMMEFRFGQGDADTLLAVMLLGVSVTAIIGALLLRQSMKQGAYTLLAGGILGYLVLGSGMVLVPFLLMFSGGILAAIGWRREVGSRKPQDRF